MWILWDTAPARPGSGERGRVERQAQADEESGAAVSGELLPHDGTTDRVGASIGLRPLAADLGPERRALAIELRRSFTVLGLSVRAYAASRHHSASSVSRYLSGETVAPDHFVATLMDDVGRKLGRPISVQARARMTDLQRAALRATDSRSWKVQDLEDRLAAALQDAQIARTQADAVATLLHLERERAAGLEAERQELAVAVAAHQAEGTEVEMLRAEQHRGRAERDALLRRVADLEAALEAAERCVARTEQRCAQLERELLAADAEVAAGEDRERERQEAEFARLRAADVRDREAAPAASYATGRGPETVPAVTIVNGDPDRGWAEELSSTFQMQGHFVTVVPWNPMVKRNPGPLLEQVMARQPGLVLLLLNAMRLTRAEVTDDHWDQVLSLFTAQQRDRLAVVWVGPCDSLPTPLGALRASELTDDLTGDDVQARVQALLDRSGQGAFRATPRVWGGVPNRNAAFTGRDALLDNTHLLLRDARVVTLYGMPGIGKTQLATEYAHRFTDEYDIVWWIPAGPGGAVGQGFAGLARALGLRAGVRFTAQVAAARDALRSGVPYRRWLLVLDGADEPDEVAGMVPEGPGHVLITSRNPKWSEHDSTLLEVCWYRRDESVSFLHHRAPQLPGTEADRLADAVGDLPLLLDQAALRLQESGLPDEECTELLGTTLDHRVLPVSSGYPVPFGTLWSEVLDKLRTTAPEALDLLRLCAFFAPGPVPVHLLDQMPRRELPEGIAALLDEPRRWNRAVHALRRCSAVRTEPDDTTGRTMSLHPVVQRIVRNGIPEEERNLLAGVARRALAAADPGEPADIATWPRYADVLPHLRYADAHRGDGSDERRLIRNCLVHLRLSGQWAAGVELGEQALQALRDRAGGDDDPAVWNLIHQYTPLLCAVGDYRRAEELDRAAAESAARVAGLQDPRYVQATARVSADLLGSGAYRDAVPELTTAAETFARLFGEADLRTADARLRLAVAFRVLGDYRRALQLDGECVDVYRRQVGRHDMSCLVAETHCAVDLRLLGQYPEATSVQRPVVDAARHLLGPDHPVTLRAEHSLGLCLLEQGDRTAAGGLVAGALRRARDTVGEQNPLALVFASSLSCLQRVYGDLDRAAELSARVVANCEAQFDEGHPWIAGARANHGLVLLASADLTRARALLEQALKDMHAAVGEDHPWTLGCAVNTSVVRDELGQKEAAVALSQDTADRAVTLLGRGHPLSLQACLAHAAALRSSSPGAPRNQLERETLADLAALWGADDERTLAARRRARPYWNFEPQVV